MLTLVRMDDRSYSLSNAFAKEPFICFLIRKMHLSDKGNVGAAVSVLLALIARIDFLSIRVYYKS